MILNTGPAATGGSATEGLSTATGRIASLSTLLVLLSSVVGGSGGERSALFISVSPVFWLASAAAAGSCSLSSVEGREGGGHRWWVPRAARWASRNPTRLCIRPAPISTFKLREWGYQLPQVRGKEQCSGSGSTCFLASRIRIH